MELKKLLDHLYEAAYMVDENRKIVYWNQEAERITGYSKEEVINQYCYNNILRHVNDEGVHLCHSGCPLQKSIHSQEVLEAKVYLHHKLGYRIPVYVRTIPYVDETTQKKMGVEVFTDIIKESDLYEENITLKEKVTMDPLTKVYNKGFIDYQLEVLIKESTVFNTSLGLLFIDIDHFKNVNDTYGHDVGDTVLKTMAQTLKHNVRKEGYVGRFGGEEFIIILRNVTKEEMILTAEKLRFLIESSSIEVDQALKIRITVSIGASYLEANKAKDKLIKEADQAMYEAKKTGRNKVVLSK